MISATIEDFEKALERLRCVDHRMQLEFGLISKAETLGFLGEAFDFFANLCDELQKSGMIKNKVLASNRDKTLGNIDKELIDADNAERAKDF